MTRLSSLRAARPSFLEGLARIFDFGNTLADPRYAPAFDDAATAFAHDWRVLGQDLMSTLRATAPSPRNRNSSSRPFDPETVDAGDSIEVTTREPVVGTSRYEERVASSEASRRPVNQLLPEE